MGNVMRRQRQSRTDGWMNVLNGYGTSKDQRSYNKFGRTSFITMEQAEALFIENGTFRKICTAPADEATRVKFCLKDGEQELDINDDIQSLYEDYQGELQMSKALSFDRCYGGSVIFANVVDGQELFEPLNIDKITAIESIKVYSAREVNPCARYIDTNNPKYEQVETYTINDGETGANYTVHESRLIILDGGVLPNNVRRARNGWGAMILESIDKSLGNYDEANSLAMMLLSRLSQGIMKIEGLMNQLQMTDGETNVRKYINMIDLTRHIMNTVAIDGKDDYEMKNVSVTGVSDIIDRMQGGLSADATIPISILFGRSTAGLNSSGDADFETYYSMVERIMRIKLKPALSKLVQIIAIAHGIKLPDKFTIEFEPLKIPSEKEKAEAKNLEAQAKAHEADAAKTYHDIGSLDSMEIRDTLEEHSDYKIDRTLDNTGQPPKVV
jgi:phage-related protein (TIGR01555 family)